MIMIIAAKPKNIECYYGNKLGAERLPGSDTTLTQNRSIRYERRIH